MCQLIHYCSSEIGVARDYSLTARSANASIVLIKLHNSTVVIFYCVVLPAVCSLIADVCHVALVTNSDNLIEIYAGLFVVFVNSFRPVTISSKAAATPTRLSNES